MTEAPPPSDPSTPGPATEHAWFVDCSGWIVRGALILGALRGFQQLIVASAALVGGLPPFLTAVASAGAEFVAFGIGGLVAAAVVRALGAWAESALRADRIGPLPADLLLRALSQPPSAEAVDSPGRAAEEPHGAAAGARLAEIRRLIREAAWDEAQEAVAAFRSDSPEDPRAAEASDELEAAMRSALERLEAELEAARGVNDPEQAMVIYSRMQPLVGDRARGERDADLARWFLLVVHRRLRGGRIQPDVVGLADRVAEQFGHTKEGASLRAALPTLRRSAGLCPRCGKPFTGAADACPECLGAPPPSPLVEPEEDEDEEMRGDRREPDWYTEPSDESAA